MATLNQVMLMGNVTRDPRIKQLPNETVLAEFGLAVNRKYRTADGENREETCFVDCTAFGKQAEILQRYCTRGKPLFVQGRLRYDAWDDKQGGGKRSKLSVVVDQFQFIGAKDGGGSFAGAGAETEKLLWRDEVQPDPKPADRPGAKNQRAPRVKAGDIPF